MSDSRIIIERNYAGDCLPGLPCKYVARYEDDDEGPRTYGSTPEATRQQHIDDFPRGD